jgi:hypothetical protein
MSGNIPILFTLTTFSLSQKPKTKELKTMRELVGKFDTPRQQYGIKPKIDP